MTARPKQPSLVLTGHLASGHRSPVCALACSQSKSSIWNGALVASGDEGGTVRIWDCRVDNSAAFRSVGLLTFACPESAGRAETLPVTSLAFHPEQSEQLVSAVGNHVFTTDLRQLGKSLILQTDAHRLLLTAADEINNLSFSTQPSVDTSAGADEKNGRAMVAAGVDDGSVLIYEPTAEQVYALKPSHANICSAVSFRVPPLSSSAATASSSSAAPKFPDLFSGGLDGQLVHWKKTGHAFDYKRVAAYDQMAASLTDPSPGQIVNPAFVNSLCSFDSQLLVVGLGDGSIAYYNATTGKLLHRPLVHRSGVPAILQLTTEQRLLLSGGTDGELVISSVPEITASSPTIAKAPRRGKGRLAKPSVYSSKVVCRVTHGSKIQALASSASLMPLVFVSDITGTPSIYSLLS